MIGQTLNNRYKISSLLGEGGMGEVYLATDEQDGQHVAVKVLAIHLRANSEMLMRFQREAKTLRQLEHPNIVKFVDAFEHEGQFVIVMEYVPGGSLHDLLKNGPLSIEQTRKISLGLCDALIRSHQLNIIHRDLKPENVLIAQDGTPKLTDFGVARLSEGTRMTQSGMKVGTAPYMSPEAWDGKVLDEQTDIWSMGVMFFEMLTSQVPFEGDTDSAIMKKVFTINPPELRKLRSDIPKGLARTIRRMLERDKKKRYQTMRQIAVDLEQIQQPVIPLKKRRVIPSVSVTAVTIMVGMAILFGFLVRSNSALSTSPNDLSSRATDGSLSVVAVERSPTSGSTLPVVTSTIPAFTPTVGQTASEIVPTESANAAISFGIWNVFEYSCTESSISKILTFDIDEDGTFLMSSGNEGTWNVIGNEITFFVHRGLIYNDNGTFSNDDARYIGIIDGNRIKQGQIIFTIISNRTSLCWDALFDE